MSETSELIFLAEVRSKISKEKTLEENMKIAMEEANDHWLISQYNDERKEFDLAVLAVAALYGMESPEMIRIKGEMDFIRAIYFTPSNVPVDWNQLMDRQPKDMKPIGLIKMWKDIRK